MPCLSGAARAQLIMSLALKLSSIRARYEQASLATNTPEIMDICASNMLPMLNALDRYAKALSSFQGQKWADAEMRQACEDFGVEPPPEIT
jgi:hypothetical protein